MLVAAPVGARDAEQLERADLAACRARAARGRGRRSRPCGRSTPCGYSRVEVDLLGARGARGAWCRARAGRAAARPCTAPRVPGRGRWRRRATAPRARRARRGDDARHLRLDRGEIFRRQPLGDVEIVVETMLDGRPDAQPRAREQALDGRGHDVRRAVPHGLQVSHLSAPGEDRIAAPGGASPWARRSKGGALHARAGFA